MTVDINLLKELEDYLLNQVFKLLNIDEREKIRIAELVEESRNSLEDKFEEAINNDETLQNQLGELLKEMRENTLNSFKMFRKAKLENKRYSENYSFHIVDDFGEEEYNKVADFNKAKFDNHINRVHLYYSLYDYDKELNLEIRISFGLSRSYSELSISMTSQRAKEIAMGIERSIFSIIKNYKNSNYIYADRIGFDAIFTGVCVGGITMALLTIRYYLVESLTAILIILGFLSYRTLLKKYKPYCEFDTRQQEKYNESVKWFNRLMIGFLITGILLVGLRKYFLNY